MLNVEIKLEEFDQIKTPLIDKINEDLSNQEEKMINENTIEEIRLDYKLRHLRICLDFLHSNQVLLMNFQ